MLLVHTSTLAHQHNSTLAWELLHGGIFKEPISMGTSAWGIFKEPITSLWNTTHMHSTHNTHSYTATNITKCSVHY